MPSVNSFCVVTVSLSPLREKFTPLREKSKWLSTLLLSVTVAVYKAVIWYHKFGDRL